MRDFKGFRSLQEVECTGRDLNPEMDLLSLSVFRMSDSAALGTLHVIKNSCFTHSDFSSCSIDLKDSRQSRLRILVADLSEGESRQYGCEASVINAKGRTNTSVWTVVVTRASK